MKRETIVALILGIFMGGVVAIILILNLRDKSIEKKRVIQLKVTPTVLIEKGKVENLEISTPSKESTINKDTITIKGNAKKNSLLVFHSPAGEKVIRLEGENFSLEFPLLFGLNTINVTSYNDGKRQEKILEVIRLEE